MAIQASQNGSADMTLDVICPFLSIVSYSQKLAEDAIRCACISELGREGNMAIHAPRNQLANMNVDVICTFNVGPERFKGVRLIQTDIYLVLGWVSSTAMSIKRYKRRHFDMTIANNRLELNVFT